MVGSDGERHSHHPVDRFCLFLTRAGRTPITIKNYRSDIEYLVRWIESQNHRPFGETDLAAANLSKYRGSLIKLYKSATVNRRLASLKIFLQWAVDVHLLPPEKSARLRNVRTTRKERSQPRSLNPSEQLRLQQAVRSHGKDRDAAMITLVLNTGMRVSELCSLSWSDIRIGGTEAAMIVREARKGYERWVPLNLEARAAFMSLGYQNKSGTQEPVFISETGPVTRGKIEIAIARYSEMAELRNVTPAVLRATFCRNLANAGVGPEVLAKLVGHRNNLEKVLCYYEHSPQDFKQAVAKLSADDDAPRKPNKGVISGFFRKVGSVAVTSAASSDDQANHGVPPSNGEHAGVFSNIPKSSVAESKRKTKTRSRNGAPTE